MAASIGSGGLITDDAGMAAWLDENAPATATAGEWQGVGFVAGGFVSYSRRLATGQVAGLSRVGRYWHVQLGAGDARRSARLGLRVSFKAADRQLTAWGAL
jgi:hypothetical protein